MPWRKALIGVVLLASALVVGVTWAVASPLGASPDDDYHQTSIWCPPPIEESGCRLLTDADSDGQVDGVRVPAAVAASTCYAFKSDDAASCVESLSPSDTSSTTRVDRGLYPGPYYHVMHLFVGDDVIRSVLAMRVFNVVLAVALLGTLLVLAPLDVRRLVVMSTLASFIPLGVFIIASVNPSSWALTGLTTMWLALHTLLLSGTRSTVVGSAALVLIGATVAATSRGDAGAYIVLVTVAVVTVHGRAAVGRPWRLAAPALACAIGVATFLRSSQTGVLESGFAAQTGRRAADVLFHNALELPGLLAGVFGVNWGLGWLDTAMPAITYVGAAVVASGLVLVGLAVLGRSKIAGLAILGSGLLALPLYVLQQSLDLVGENVQPRYFLPLVPALVGLSLIGKRPALTVSLRLGQTVVVYALLTLAHSFALHANIRRYVTGQDVLSFRLGENAEWWWTFGPGPMQIWALGSAAFAIVALSLFLVRDRRAEVPDGGGAVEGPVATPSQTRAEADSETPTEHPDRDATPSGTVR